MSGKLKAIYHSEEVRIVEDVGLTVDVVEKIVTNISPENFNKTPDVRKSFRESLSYTVQNLFEYGDFLWLCKSLLSVSIFAFRIW